MTISIDSNVIAALWMKSHSLNLRAATMLTRAQKLGKLMVSGPVYSELRGDPARSEGELEEFFQSTGVTIDWIL